MIPSSYASKTHGVTEIKMSIKHEPENGYFKAVKIRKIAPPPMEVIRVNYPTLWRFMNILSNGINLKKIHLQPHSINSIIYKLFSLD